MAGTERPINESNRQETTMSEGALPSRTTIPSAVENSGGNPMSEFTI